jgi:hypothetical protein
MQFSIPNQTRRGLAASRLKREGYDVHAEMTRRDAAEHPLEIRDVEGDPAAVELLVSQIAPEAVRIR